MIRLLQRSALILALVAMVALPLARAEAQSSVNPYLPMTTKPPGPTNPKPVNPGAPVTERNPSGVIAPPVTDSRMPVIHPNMPSNMPVIPPAGTPGGNPAVIPK